MFFALYAFNDIKSGTLPPGSPRYDAQAGPLGCCYARPSKLVLGGRALTSGSGVQQGDPLGLLLFALPLHPLAKELASARSDSDLSLLTFYLDDGFLGRSAEAVAAALRALLAGGPDLPSGQLSAAASALFPAALLRDELTGGDRVNRSGDFELHL